MSRNMTAEQFVNFVNPHVSFQGVEAPQLPPGSTPAYGIYFKKKLTDEMRVLPKSSEVDGYVLQARESLKRYGPWLPHFSEMDYYLCQDITCGALGRKSSEFEQTGFLGFDNEKFWSQEAEDLVYSRWKPYVDAVKVDDLKLNVPKDTNLCWPILNAFKGAGNAAFLWAYSCLAAAVLTEKISLNELMAKLRMYFGNPFIALGYRISSSGKTLNQPLKNGGYVNSSNVFNRVRAIWLGIKILLMIVRLAVKRVVKAATTHPNHKPFLPWIKKFFDEHDASGWVLGMIDASKFDKRAGGNIMRGVAYLLSRLTGLDVKYFLAEMDLPCAFFYQRQWYFNELVSQLWSGIGSTTPVGLLTIDLYIAEVEVRTGLKLDRDFKYLSWGDDQVYSFRTQEVKDRFYKCLEELGFVFSEEPFRKYLGHYFFTRYNNEPMIPLAVFIKKSLDPENVKVDKHALTIALIARYEYARPEDQASIRAGLEVEWLEPFFGPVFDWAKKDEVLANAVANVGAPDLRRLIQALYSGLEIADVIKTSENSPLIQALKNRYEAGLEHRTDDDLVDEGSGMMDLSLKERELYIRTHGPLVQDGFRRAADRGDVDILITLGKQNNAHWESGGPMF